MAERLETQPFQRHMECSTPFLADGELQLLNCSFPAKSHLNAFKAGAVVKPDSSGMDAAQAWMLLIINWKHKFRRTPVWWLEKL